jgi:2-polyprenyl-6-methoxyphenol hydroxylase-like FAD-dependent oxidoreductase
MPTHTSREVLVVGAGPTGLTLGCQLLRAGARCRVVERAGSRARESRALGVHARTLEILEGLGLLERALRAGQKAEFISLHVGGRPLVRLPYRDVDAPHPYMLIVPQYETERLLEERFVELGGAVERGVALGALAQRGDGVDVVLTRKGGDEQAWYDYVVGCDGARSTVREAIGAAFEGEQYEETFVLADVRLDLDVPRNEAHAFASRGGVVAVLPLASGKFRVLGPAGGRLPPGPSGPLPFETFQSIIRELGVVGDARLSEPDWVARFNVHRRIASTYRVGRVLLAGDAAHIHSPAGGQGMNVGIQDATNLAWKLALVVRGAAPAALLDSYQAERRPVALATISGTDSVTKLATLRHPLAVALRDRLVPWLLGRVLGRRTLLAASQLAVTYRTSAIVSGERGRGPRSLLGTLAWLALSLVRAFGPGRRGPEAGDRAPDAAFFADGADRPPRRLHTILSGRAHTLLAFAGDASRPGRIERARAAVEAARAFGPDVRARVVTRTRGAAAELAAEDVPVLLDETGALHRRYAAKRGRLCLVRPDGYLGFTGALADGDRLTAHLARFLPTQPDLGHDRPPVLRERERVA